MWRKASVIMLVSGLACGACLCGCGASMPTMEKWDHTAQTTESPDTFLIINREDLDRAVGFAAEGMYGQATDILRPMVARSRGRGLVAFAGEARFWLGYCYEKQGQTPTAASLYRQTITEYPQSQYAKTANERLIALTASPAIPETPAMPVTPTTSPASESPATSAPATTRPAEATTQAGDSNE